METSRGASSSFRRMFAGLSIIERESVKKTLRIKYSTRVISRRIAFVRGDFSFGESTS